MKREGCSKEDCPSSLSLGERTLLSSHLRNKYKLKISLLPSRRQTSTTSVFSQSGISGKLCLQQSFHFTYNTHTPLDMMLQSQHWIKEPSYPAWLTHYMCELGGKKVYLLSLSFLLSESFHFCLSNLTQVLCYEVQIRP